MIVCLYDKFLAKKKKYRISEKLLLGICAIGGVFGFYIISRIIHHKNRDKKFLLFMYPILIAWLFIGILIVV